MLFMRISSVFVNRFFSTSKSSVKFSCVILIASKNISRISFLSCPVSAFIIAERKMWVCLSSGSISEIKAYSSRRLSSRKLFWQNSLLNSLSICHLRNSTDVIGICLSSNHAPSLLKRASASFLDGNCCPLSILESDDVEQSP